MNNKNKQQDESTKEIKTTEVNVEEFTEKELQEIQEVKDLIKELEAEEEETLEDVLVGITILLKADGSISIEPLIRDDYDQEYGKLLGQLIYAINSSMLEQSFLDMLSSIYKSKDYKIKKIAKLALKEWNSEKSTNEFAKPSNVLQIGVQKMNERQQAGN